MFRTACYNFCFNHKTQFRRLKRRNVYCICQYFWLLCPLFLYDVPRFLLLSFPFCLEDFRQPFFFYKFIYFWLHWVFVAAHGLSLVVASGGYSFLRCVGFSLWWLLLLWSTGSRHMDFSSCSTWAQQLQRTGLVAPRHVGSSLSRAQTRVPCIGRQILNHCTTREALFSRFYRQVCW